MRKLFIFLMLLFLTMPAYCDYQFQGTSATANETPEGTTMFNDIDTTIFQEIVDPMGRLLQEYRKGAKLVYSSGTTLIIEPGQLATQDTAGSRILFSESTANINATFASNLDTGSEAPSKTYYVYGIGSLTSGTFTVKFSEDATTPSGSDYYIKLGSFYNNASSNIEQISNEGVDILIVTGTVTHGNAIPLPSGYTQSQCKWMVSANDVSKDGYGQYESDDSGVRCSVNSSRVVSVSAYSLNTWETGGTVNYMIIGYK